MMRFVSDVLKAAVGLLICVTDGMALNSLTSGSDGALVTHLKNLNKQTGHDHRKLEKSMTSTTTDDDGASTDGGPLGALFGRMWWEGPAVCAKNIGSHNSTENVVDEPSTAPDRNTLTLCHVSDDVRICRTLQSTNGSAMEEMLTTTYECCAGHELVGNECTAILDSDKNGRSPSQSATDSPAESTRDDLLLQFFQQIMEGSLRSSQLLSRAMNSDSLDSEIKPRQRTLNPNEEIVFEDSQPASMPIVFVRRQGPIGTSNQTIQSEKPAAMPVVLVTSGRRPDNESASTSSPVQDNSATEHISTVQNTHSNLHLSLIL